MKTKAVYTAYMRDNIANILTVGGIGAITAGAWIISPAAGLIVFGILAAAVGIGIVRSQDDS